MRVCSGRPETACRGALAENRLDVSAYRCVGVVGRNRKNDPRPSSLLCPVVIRQVPSLTLSYQVCSSVHSFPGSNGHCGPSFFLILRPIKPDRGSGRAWRWDKHQGENDLFGLMGRGKRQVSLRYGALDTSIFWLITLHCLSDVRKAISEASRPLPIRTMPSIGASLVGSMSHQPFSR
jgi:hypothetical protein